jgi:hypothetical protein
MEISVLKMHELEDGSAIVELDLDEEAKEWLIGEGFLSVLKRSLKVSKSVVKKKKLQLKPVKP